MYQIDGATGAVQATYLDNLLDTARWKSPLTASCSLPIRVFDFTGGQIASFDVSTAKARVLRSTTHPYISDLYSTDVAAVSEP